MLSKERYNTAKFNSNYNDFYKCFISDANFLLYMCVVCEQTHDKLQGNKFLY